MSNETRRQIDNPENQASVSAERAVGDLRQRVQGRSIETFGATLDGIPDAMNLFLDGS